MKNMIGRNGLPMTDLIGQQHSLVGKWPMADRYIVLCMIMHAYICICSYLVTIATLYFLYYVGSYTYIATKLFIFMSIMACIISYEVTSYICICSYLVTIATLYFLYYVGSYTYIATKLFIFMSIMACIISYEVTSYMPI